MTLAAGARLGSYEILGALGAGGMGEVYRALDTKLRREVAVKVLPEAFARDEERMKRFAREAQVLASLNHPYVAAIYGLEESDRVSALVLELVEGPTLAERIAAGPIPREEALRIGVQIAQGLEAAHEKAVVHRDLKPANVKLTRDGDVKILDFGLAKALDGGPAPVEVSQSPTRTRTTDVGVLLGTAPYMSPEQAKGRAADRRADVWAFGVVLFEMLSGRRPFSGEDVSETLAQILTKEPDWSALPAGTPSRTLGLLRRCLTKDPKQRLQAIGEARIALEEPGEDLPLTPPARWPAFAGAAAALALAVALWALWSRPAPNAPPPPIRLSVDLGVDASLVPNPIDEGQSVLLSPDGRLLVFAALPTPEALPHLYARRLDELEASLLPGTEGARNPFFSPDGQWVAFFAEGKLKKTSVNGGGAVAIAGVNVVGYHGGWWAADGSIVFVQDDGKGSRLARVSSAGGTPMPLPGTDSAHVETWPQVLPSGRAVLYSTGNTAHEGPALLARELPGGPAKVLVRDASHGRYLPSGHLIFIRDGALYAVAFDLDRLEVVGEPARALDSVRSAMLTGGAWFSASDRGTLAYVPGSAVPSTIQWVDRSRHLKPLRAIPGSYAAPDFSPDGRRLAMDITEGREQDVWIYEWATERLTRLTFDPAQDTLPVWTPDGKRIAFSSTRGRNGVRNLYWQRADGTGEAERLTDSENHQWLGSWHPDGRHLAFAEMSTLTARPDIMILEMEGSEEQGWRPGKITRFVESPDVDNLPAFSPDGRWLAYMSNQTGRFEVYVRPFPGPGGIWQVSTQSGRYPVWSRVRRELFFWSSDETMMVVPYTVEGKEFRAERPRLWSEARVPGSTRLFLALHPDGARFALVAPLVPFEARRNKAVLVLNFFDHLRSVAPRSLAAR